MNPPGTAPLNGRRAALFPVSSRDALNLSRTHPANELGLPGHVTPRPIGAVATADMHCELLQLPKDEPAEMKFAPASHLVILLPDGMSCGCEWNSDEHAGRSPSLSPNTIIFKPAHGYLRLRARGSQARVLLLTIAPDAIDRVFGKSVETASVNFVQRIGVDDEDVRRTLLAFLHEMENPGWNSRFYIDTLLALLLSQLVRCASNLTRPKPIPWRKGGLSNWRLKRARELLAGDPGHAPSLADVARELRLHPSSLCRAFKQSTGQSPHRYLLCYRLDRAKEMMRDQSRTLTDIALTCGFSDSSQFSSTFKRILGMAPREYRRLL